MRLTENQKRIFLHSGLFLTLLALTLLSLYLTFLCSTTDFQLRSLPITANASLFFTHLLPYPSDKEEK